jgi:hypothetical protein
MTSQRRKALKTPPNTKKKTPMKKNTVEAGAGLQSIDLRLLESLKIPGESVEEFASRLAEESAAQFINVRNPYRFSRVLKLEDAEP